VIEVSVRPLGSFQLMTADVPPLPVTRLG